MTPLQIEVVNMACKELGRDHSILNVCIDQLPDDTKILRKGIEQTADAIVIDTLYWEKGIGI
jgi:hypothetical protein